MASALPGVKVGPLDPDATAEFGQVAQKNSARTLIRLHSQLHPPALTQALARPLDHERTKGLVMDEVRGYLRGLTREDGDPMVPRGAVVEGAQVRGDRDRQQVLTFTYRLAKSGRSGKWFTEYDAGELPDSARLGDELVHIAEMRERGLVTQAWDTEGTSAEILRRQAAGLRRENEALRAELGGSGDGEDVPETRTDVRPDVSVVEENERLRREIAELAARVPALEAAVQKAAERGTLPDDAPDAADLTPRTGQDEPVEGYDELNARQVIALVRDDGTPQESRAAILDYERTHSNRRSVVAAAEKSIG